MPNNNSNQPSAVGRLGRIFQRAASTMILTSDGAATGATPSRQKEDTEFFASLEQSYNSLRDDDDSDKVVRNNENSNTKNALGLNKMAFFSRSEVEAGVLMTKGGFTTLHAVSSIQLDARRRKSPPHSEKQQKRRHIIRSNVRACTKQQQGGPPTLSSRYAIKQLTPKILHESDPQTLAKATRHLVNDAKFLARLCSGADGNGHPNIPKLHAMTLDAFGHNYLAHAWDDFFLLTDGIQANDTLADRIYGPWKARGSDGEPDEDLIPLKANYAFQIAKALRYCHQQGVLFRDCKPPNVGFSGQDSHVVQLLDFGLARDFDEGREQLQDDSADRCITLAGTRRYLAGEVLATGLYTFKSDAYTWAMTFYELLSERKPFAGLSAGEHQLHVCLPPDEAQSSRHTGVLRPSLEDSYLPEELETILIKSWHADLSKRSSMDEICDQMRTFLMEVDVSYYEEPAFLFDIHVGGSGDQTGEEVEALRCDEDWECMGGQSEAFQSSTAAVARAGRNPDLTASFKSTESEDVAGNAGPVRETPWKIISSAA